VKRPFLATADVEGLLQRCRLRLPAVCARAPRHGHYGVPPAQRATLAAANGSPWISGRLPSRTLSSATLIASAMTSRPLVRAVGEPQRDGGPDEALRSDDVDDG